jgi:hypothetical protein
MCTDYVREQLHELLLAAEERDFGYKQDELRKMQRCAEIAELLGHSNLVVSVWHRWRRQGDLTNIATHAAMHLKMFNERLCRAKKQSEKHTENTGHQTLGCNDTVSAEHSLAILQIAYTKNVLRLAQKKVRALHK